MAQRKLPSRTHYYVWTDDDVKVFIYTIDLVEYTNSLKEDFTLVKGCIKTNIYSLVTDDDFKQIKLSVQHLLT